MRPWARSRDPRDWTTSSCATAIIWGTPGLRELLAAAGEGLRPEQVLLTPGAVAALFIIHTALLGRGDHLVVIRPNYSTNLDTPRAVAADIGIVDLTFESGWAIDPERLAAAMRPDTKLVSITVPHNPTGATLDVATLLEIVRRVERSGARLLVDETYREMTLGGPLQVAASLSDRVISVSSVSKTYGLPGCGPAGSITRDADWFERFLAAKEQMLISGSVVDEELTYRALRRRTERLPAILADIRQAARYRRRMDRRRTRARVGSAAGRRRRLPADPDRSRRGRRTVL